MPILMLLIYFAKDVITWELCFRKEARRGSVRYGRPVRAPKALQFAAACNHHIKIQIKKFLSISHFIQINTVKLIWPLEKSPLTT